MFNDDSENFGTRTNTIPMVLDGLSVGTDGTKNFLVELIIDSPDAEVTVGGTPSFADVETASSVTEVDIAGTTVSGGTKIAAFSLSKVDGLVWQPTREIVIQPGEKLYVATSSAANGDITVSLNWSERQ